jgi:hypothetical protein
MFCMRDALPIIGLCNSPPYGGLSITRIKFKSFPIENKSPLVTLYYLMTFKKVPEPTPES